MRKASNRLSIRRIFHHARGDRELAALSKAEELFARLCARAYLSQLRKTRGGANATLPSEEEE